MNSLKRFWQAVELLPTLAAVEAEWLALLRGEYGLIKPFLRPRKDRASSFPRLDGGLPYQVVEHMQIIWSGSAKSQVRPSRCARASWSFMNWINNG